MVTKHILVPTDFSVSSKSALSLAVSLANGDPATSITLLHVVEPSVPAYDSELGVLEPEALKTELEALDAGRSLVTPIEAEISYGEPAAGILEFANQHAVDLIVMGTRGRNTIADLLVGNTAEKVMRNAKCPVLSVRADSVVPADSPSTIH